QDVAERCFALGRPVVRSRDNLYGTRQDVGRERGCHCFVGCAQVFILLPGPHRTGHDKKRSGGGEAGPGPAGQIRPPVHGDHGRLVGLNVRQNAALERAPILAFGGRCVDSTEYLRDLRIAFVFESQIGTINHLQSLKFPSKTRNFCLAWCKSERAVPPGIPNISPISACVKPSTSWSTITERARSGSFAKAASSRSRSSPPSAGSRNEVGIDSESSSAFLTLRRRARSRAALATIRLSHAPKVCAGSNRSSAWYARRNPSCTASSASSCVNTIDRATMYARR